MDEISNYKTISCKITNNNNNNNNNLNNHNWTNLVIYYMSSLQLAR